MTRQIWHSGNGSTRLLADVRQRQYAAWDAILTTAENNSGELSLTIEPNNPEYNVLETMRSELCITEDDNEVWRGRLIAQQTDLSGRKKLTVKGLPDYLHDTLVQVGTLSGTASAVLRQVISAHNAACTEHCKTFSVGTVTVSGTVEHDGQQKQSPWDVVSALTKTYGGRIAARYEDGVRYLDWLSTEVSNLDTCTQELREGNNLLSLVQTVDGSSLITRLYGYGKTVGGTPLTTASVNSGKEYVEDAEAVAAFGIIAGVLYKSDIDDPTQLLAAMREELRTRLESARELTAGAVDLYDLGQAAEPFEIGKKVRVIAERIGVDDDLRVVKIQRNLFRPKNTKITLGTATRYASQILRR